MAPLLGVCALVLLIACANVPNLMLARAVARRGQTAVRLVMGASRRQIMTEALVESILLALVTGIVFGVAPAWFARGLRRPPGAADVLRVAGADRRRQAGADEAN